MNKSWLLVLIAGLLEVIWVSGLKYSSAWWEWLITILFIIVSFKVVIEASRKLPLGTVYAVFTGLGTAGTVIVEMLLFGEPVQITKLLFIALMASGVIGLKLLTKPEDTKEGTA
ncbi:DMT family transporter [Paenibacillus sp. 481]|uniref:DMT family transporter n=1 Tax=Paenibacillus sp. 481 TaxID=2835869 RepID=UPI001E3F4CA8|nr:multidrug efflux SMR transporter [Paenibacillus sp. 481]UHA75618.1 multidrug efflux SMR transporter [Paenibacillus sp. 481]